MDFLTEAVVAFKSESPNKIVTHDTKADYFFKNQTEIAVLSAVNLSLLHENEN